MATIVDIDRNKRVFGIKKYALKFIIRNSIKCIINFRNTGLPRHVKGNVGKGTIRYRYANTASAYNIGKMWKILVNALAAPVVVGTIDCDAALALRRSWCGWS